MRSNCYLCNFAEPKRAFDVTKVYFAFSENPVVVIILNRIELPRKRLLYGLNPACGVQAVGHIVNWRFAWFRLFDRRMSE